MGRSSLLLTALNQMFYRSNSNLDRSRCVKAFIPGAARFFPLLIPDAQHNGPRTKPAGNRDRKQCGGLHFTDKRTTAAPGFPFAEQRIPEYKTPGCLLLYTAGFDAY